MAIKKGTVSEGSSARDRDRVYVSRSSRNYDRICPLSIPNYTLQISRICAEVSRPVIDTRLAN